MKFIFKSDKFNLIHPSLLPRKYGEYSKEDLEDAIKNTSKIYYNRDLFNEANKSANGCIPENQLGSILVFPYSTREEMTEVPNPTGLMEMVKKTYEKVSYDLVTEYTDSTDPFKFFDVDNTGKYFSATFRNTYHSCFETFNSKSVVIYVAGCRHYTAEYAFEELLDRCFNEGEKWDRRVARLKEPKENKLHFCRNKTFLYYSFYEKKFRQFATNENFLYRADWGKLPKTPKRIAMPEYSFSISHENESFD